MKRIDPRLLAAIALAGLVMALWLVLMSAIVWSTLSPPEREAVGEVLAGRIALVFVGWVLGLMKGGVIGGLLGTLGLPYASPLYDVGVIVLGLVYVYLPFMLFPLIGIMTLLAFSVGILVAALTTKYRDLTFLLTFGIQLLMFMSPVIFPLAMVEKGTTLRTVIELNPMSAVLEGFRAALLGTPMEWGSLVYSCIFTVISLIVGLAMFQRIQRSFADVV